jgi:class 3 adenylate cyclase
MGLSMLGIIGKGTKLPPLKNFPLRHYVHNFYLDRLVLGVDNIRCDVYLSPTFIGATRKIVTSLVTRHAGVEKTAADAGKLNWVKEVESYKQLYREMMRDAVNKSKGRREVQIVYLAQAASSKMLLEEIRSQFDNLIGRIKKAVRKSELAVHNDSAEGPKLSSKLQRIIQEKDAILQQVGKEICAFWSEVELKEVLPMHEAVFGPRTSFYVDVINNPILHSDQPDSDIFLISEYDVVLGRRIEDPDKYETLLFFMRRLLNYIDLMEPSVKGHSMDQRLIVPDSANKDVPPEDYRAYSQKIEEVLKCEGNMDLLLNWQRTKGLIQELKKKGSADSEVSDLRNRVRDQKRLLDFCYNQFRREGLLERVVAAYEMQPEYLEYCPPLIPQQIIQYLTIPRSRRVLRNRIKRMQKMYNRSYPLNPLSKKIKAMEQMTTAKKKSYIIRFVNAFARYHREKSNAEIFKESLERINLATDEKVILLSRENNTLYEFLLPHEQAADKAPIINHVVIKADVRGSTDLTHQMNERRLNPASYFSLNFFDPISEILSEYDANKIFIEGDAIILSIFEREDTPSGWYGVARACGLALNMLIIIQRYNEKSKKNMLPILELGIGISFLEKAPTFLFDGNSRIMISSAINQADRLSSCSKTGRKLLADRKGPFNLHVFQTRSDEELAATADDLYTRYNVNGIELSALGFEKLSHEIDLQVLENEFTDPFGRHFKLYTGKFPTQSGRYQRLVLREALIPVVDPTTLETGKVTSRKYYEVCTHPKLYAYARKMTR